MAEARVSDRDSFIDEVSEEVRRDRMFALWRRFGPFVIGGVVLIVGAAGVKTWMDNEAVKDARQAGAAMIAAAEIAPTEAANALTTLADQTGREGAAVLARLRAAGVYAADGDAAKAAAAYEAVAADGRAEQTLRDFAAFRALMVKAPVMEPAALRDALAPLATGNGAFRLLAMEAKGLAELAAGDVDAATQTLNAIADDSAAPQGLRERVLAVLTAIGAPAPAAG